MVTEDYQWLLSILQTAAEADHGSRGDHHHDGWWRTIMMTPAPVAPGRKQRRKSGQRIRAAVLQLPLLMRFAFGIPKTSCCSQFPFSTLPLMASRAPMQDRRWQERTMDVPVPWASPRPARSLGSAKHRSCKTDGGGEGHLLAAKSAGDGQE
jgi:hypothetical protein